MDWLLVVIIFFLGASVGSFVNVLVSRSIAGQNWAYGRSRCDHCQKTLSWYDMVPLLSYWVYGGKSRCCGKKISMAHPVIEAMFGLLFVWWLLVGFVFFRLATTPWIVLQPLFWLGLGVFLLIVGVADYLYGVILMPVVWLGIGWIYLYRLGLVVSGVYQVSDLAMNVIGGVGSFGFLWGLRMLTKGRGMGDGDPYLALMTGSLLGGVMAFWGMLAAFIVGSIWGVGLILAGKKKLSQTMPFGPFLVAGCLAALLFSRYGGWW